MILLQRVIVPASPTIAYLSVCVILLDQELDYDIASWAVSEMYDMSDQTNQQEIVICPFML